MKVLFTVVLCVISLGLRAQDCKVVMVSINKTYSGDCKKGLAQGTGSASGIDKYEGEFRKGWPHGKGSYYWKDGTIYEGEWKNGKKHGKGKLFLHNIKKDSLVEGIWEKDKYVGKVKIRPFKINQSYSIQRSAVNRWGDGNSVSIKFMKNGGENSSIQNLRLSGSSGTEMSGLNRFGFVNVTFPLTIRIAYRSGASMNVSSGSMDCVFDCTINNPGKWEIILTN